jgi:hypothetical protein
MSYAHLHKTNRAWRLNSPDKLDGWSLGFIVKELDKLAAPKCTALLRSLRDIAKRAEKQLDVGRFFLDAHPSPSREIKTLKGVEAQFRAWLK